MVSFHASGAVDSSPRWALEFGALIDHNGIFEYENYALLVLAYFTSWSMPYLFIFISKRSNFFWTLPSELNLTRISCPTSIPSTIRSCVAVSCFKCNKEAGECGYQMEYHEILF